jgi:quercetin dioxygenase-like cupin family protein
MRLERIPWPGPGAPEESSLRRRLEDEGFDVWRWTDGPGASYAPHSHDRDESLWIVEGEIAFGAGGAELRLAAGDRLMLPRGTVHTATAGPRGATYLIGER